MNELKKGKKSLLNEQELNFNTLRPAFQGARDIYFMEN